MNYSTIFITLAALLAVAESREQTSLRASATDSTSTSTEEIEFNSKIVGGEPSDKDDFPYFVEMGGCGGTLIAPDTVLFAAHCKDYTGKQIIVGSYKKGQLDSHAEMRFCDQWVPHSSYGQGGSHLNNDIALCKLNLPVEIDESKVKLEINEDPMMPADGEDLIVMGQGALAEGGDSGSVLHDVTVPAIRNSVCRSSRMYGNRITDEMLCAGFTTGQKDSCQGDSGGPIVKRVSRGGGKYTDYHVGVVSWGIGCARVNQPGVYARTSSAIGFIRDTTCGVFNSSAEWCDNDSNEANTETEECDGEIDIVVDTDKYPMETTFTLTELFGNKDEVYKRRYFLPYYENEHKVCVKAGMCYTFEITDSHGDGLCGDDPCTKYTIGAPGRSTYHTGNGDFGKGETVKLCVAEDGKSIIGDADREISSRRPTSKPSTRRPTSKPSTRRPTKRPTRPSSSGSVSGSRSY